MDVEEDVEENVEEVNDMEKMKRTKRRKKFFLLFLKLTMTQFNNLPSGSVFVQTPPHCTITDEVARQVEAQWKAAFPDATLLPVIGLPSNNKGVLTLLHTMGDGKVLKINDLPSNSPLANGALYSAECVNGIILNLYEIMIPDIPGLNGEHSTGQIYINALHNQGLDVAGVHYHWSQSYVYRTGRKDKNVLAVHHQNFGLSPVEFSHRTIVALHTAMAAINARATDKEPDVVIDDDPVTDRQAKKIEREFKKIFSDATLLPRIGLPSNNKGVATLTHTLGVGKLAKIDGLESNSPLANNALYTFEVTNDTYLNLYEIGIPIIELEKLGISTSQLYINELAKNGLDVASIHFHWTGNTVYPQDRGISYIHHQSTSLSPKEFTRRTLRALKVVLDALKKNSWDDDHHDDKKIHKKDHHVHAERWRKHH